MKVRNASILRLITAGLAIAMLAVALACASEEPTAAPTAVPPTATSPSMTDGAQPTATPVDVVETDPTWIESYLQSPGYNPEWGEPVRGGTFIFGANRDDTRFNPRSHSCCYTHGCYAGLPWNALFRIDPWVGTLDSLEGDLVESWEMSDDGLTLTMQLRQGVMFFDQMAEQSTVPAEYNGGQILGDEFVCEDAVATYDRYVNPPEWETRIITGKTGHWAP